MFNFIYASLINKELKMEKKVREECDLPLYFLSYIPISLSRPFIMTNTFCWIFKVVTQIKQHSKGRQCCFNLIHYPDWWNITDFLEIYSYDIKLLLFVYFFNKTKMKES
jgi:hypothetical protein